jgi:phosphoribosylglycinamide formyltransferase 1
LPADLKHRLAILASGAGSNALNIIQYFKDSTEVEISLIISNRKQAGVFQIASEHHVTSVYMPASEMSGEQGLLKVLVDHRIDSVILAGFLLKVPEDVIEVYRGRIINIHPALLPKFGGKGMYGHFVHEAVFAAGERESGITVHLVDEHYDEGDIVFQAKVQIKEGDGPLEIEQKVRALEIRHFPEVIDQWLQSAKKDKRV